VGWCCCCPSTWCVGRLGEGGGKVGGHILDNSSVQRLAVGEMVLEASLQRWKTMARRPVADTYDDQGKRKQELGFVGSPVHARRRGGGGSRVAEAW
jgi:hypothetical protein